MSSEFEQATGRLVEAVIAFLEAGDAAGLSPAHLQGEFIAAFQTAVEASEKPQVAV